MTLIICAIVLTFLSIYTVIKAYHEVEYWILASLIIISTGLSWLISLGIIAKL